MVEWIDKLELLCRLCGGKFFGSHDPFAGGTYTVYQQMDDKAKSHLDQIRTALVTVFATDSFMAYKQLIERYLRYGESVNVYLAELKKCGVM